MGKGRGSPDSKRKDHDLRASIFPILDESMICCKYRTPLILGEVTFGPQTVI